MCQQGTPSILSVGAMVDRQWKACDKEKRPRCRESRIILGDGKYYSRMFEEESQ